MPRRRSKVDGGPKTGSYVCESVGAKSNGKNARKKGGPIAADVLDDLGVDGLCEMISNGDLFPAIANKLKISYYGLLRWVHAEPERDRQVIATRRMAAEIYLEKAEKVLHAAETKEGIARARELASHWRWVAKAFDKERFGDHQKVTMDGSLELKKEPKTLEEMDKQLEAVESEIKVLSGLVKKTQA